LSTRRIPPRLGIEVYENEGGTITIKQSDPMDDDHIVVVHPDDVPTLIRFLEEVRQDILTEEDSSTER
jgi:hypothetical protein